MVQAEIWRLLGKKGDRVPFIVDDAEAIPMGAFLELQDEMKVTAHGGNVDTPIVGIAAAEKKALDGKLLITGITNCVFKAKVKAGGSATIGDLTSMSNVAGELDTASATDFEAGFTVGRSYGDIGASETGLFKSTF